ncbi:unnamed protein product, partial [Polarella glacialis]
PPCSATRGDVSFSCRGLQGALGGSAETAGEECHEILSQVAALRGETAAMAYAVADLRGLEDSAKAITTTATAQFAALREEASAACQSVVDQALRQSHGKVDEGAARVEDSEEDSKPSLSRQRLDLGGACGVKSSIVHSVARDGKEVRFDQDTEASSFETSEVNCPMEDSIKPMDDSIMSGVLGVLKRSGTCILELHDPDPEDSEVDEAWRSPEETRASQLSHRASRQQKWLQKLVRSSQFEVAMGLFIVANCVSIGGEQTYRLNGDSTYVFYVAEQVFLCIYIMELILRFCANGVRCLHDNWVKFDLFLVVSGILANWIIEPVMGRLQLIGPLMVLRTVRLCRLARTVKLLVKFRELWMLVRGLLNSASTMVYTMVLLVIIVYLFAAVGVELIADNPDAETNEEFRIVRDLYFRSLPVAMLTLIQFVCLDSVGAIYKPLIESDITLVLYFSAIILVIPIVLMNLVTAVCVNGALEQAGQDKDAAKIHEEQHRKKLVNTMRVIFTRLDEDQSGQVSLDELMQVSQQDLSELERATNISDPRQIFEALDVDGRGQLGIEEFCHGIWQAAMSKVPTEVQRMERQVDSMFKRFKARDDREKACKDQQNAHGLVETVADLKVGVEKIHAQLVELRADHVRLEQLILPARLCLAGQPVKALAVGTPSLQPQLAGDKGDQTEALLRAQREIELLRANLAEALGQKLEQKVKPVPTTALRSSAAGGGVWAAI